MNHLYPLDPSDCIIIDREAPEARDALDGGHLRTATGRVRVSAHDLIQREDGRREIVFRVREVVPARNLRERLDRMRVAVRAISLTATAMPCLAVLAVGISHGAKPAIGVAASALFGALLLQVAVNLYNDVTDYQKLIDLPGTPGGSGVFERAWYTPREILGAARLALIAAILAGVPALIAYPIQILAIGSLGVAGALLYSHASNGLKYRGLGDVAVFFLCGPLVTTGFSFAAFGSMESAAIPLGVVLGLLACGLLHVNNLQDMEYDRSRGAATLASRIGFGASRRLLVVIYVLAGLTLAGAIGSGAMPLATAIAFGAVFPVVHLCRVVCDAIGPSSPKLDRTRDLAAQIHLLVGILISLGAFFSIAVSAAPKGP